MERTATTIRMPSTANLMIDSDDRNTAIYTSAWDFQIQKNQSIQNGFFTRIGVTEVVLEWCVENISTTNNKIIVDISGATGTVSNQTITLTGGFYTVEEVLDGLAKELTDLSGTTGSSFFISQTPDGSVFLNIDVGEFNIAQETTLSDLLGMGVISAPGIPGYLISSCADLRPYRYIDFVSNQLTYCQDLKDNSTASKNLDVLVRWYMAWDDQPQYDTYGFPILMGYKKFVLRRLFNPPKQIKWDSTQPLGNLAFQVYDPSGNLLTDADTGNNFLMTLQLSEC